MDEFIEEKLKEQLQKFPAVSGFRWETYFKNSLLEAYELGVRKAAGLAGSIVKDHLLKENPLI